MKPNPKISAAVAAILSATGTGLIWAAAPADQDTATAASSGGELAEVVVTAQRRSENLQDVPITIQAISGEQLTQLNVVSFQDLLKYTPNVTFSGNGPGTGNIWMRGLGSVGSGNQSQSTTAPFPNVGLYLDDQSMQFPARNNDVYLVDMERVEVLEGPQGTLFGGGAQAGAIRYITNKPNLSATSGEFNAGYGITAGGDPNTMLNAVLNVPLINDVLALRGVVFSERRGGYIDNVQSTIGYFPGTPPHDLGGNPTASNSALVADNTNPVDYQGARLSALWKVNDNWNVLLQQNYQNMQADGYFYAYPIGTAGQPLAQYQINAFTPAFTKDRYDSTSWTVNGKIGDLLNAVYTGSYMVRNIDGQQDYSNYMRSVVGSYYACIGTNAGFFNPTNFPTELTGHKLQCSSPVGDWTDVVHNTHQSHEIRLSTNTDSRIRGLVGAYWEKFVINDNQNFNYLGIPQCNQANLNAANAGGPDCLSAVGPFPGYTASDPTLRENSNTAFGEDDQRGYKQTAGFASIDVDLIPKVLTVTGGFRWFHYDEFEHGSEYYSETTAGAGTPGGVVNNLNGACVAAGNCAEPISLDKTETGHRWRGNLTWHVTQDLMAYYTYSEGFRPGGFNRTYSPVGTVNPVGSGEGPYCASATANVATLTAPDPRCRTGGSLAGLNTKQFNKPAGYDSDQLTNNEIGVKSEWFEHHLIVNVSGYIMKWTNVQLPLFDPVNLGNTTFDVNGPSYKVKGFEVQFVAKLFGGLSLEGSSSINSTEQTNTPCLQSGGTATSANNPTPLGQCITVVKEQKYLSPFGIVGQRTAFSPPWMFNLRARYDMTLGAYQPFAWVGASHIGPQSNEPLSFPSGAGVTNPTTTYLRYEIPSYTTYDAAFGVGKDNWTAQVSGQNLTNEYGPTNISSGQFIQSQIPLRPRVIMFQIGYKF